MPKKTLDEDRLVQRIERVLASGPEGRATGLKLGMGDDAALFAPTRGYETILTCDWFLEGTHFLRDWHPADAVGWKCLARALSDVAAMGGVPRCFLVSLALPSSHAGRWLDEFLGGMRRAARRFGCVAAGGDTTQRNEILINIMVVGEVRSRRAILRSGAKPGDWVFVSGRLGEADLGLRLLRRSKGKTETRNPLVQKHLYPEPRLALGMWLAERRIASAMMDISDGLSSDLPRLCAASGVGARIDEAKLPIVKLPRNLRLRGCGALQMALHGGDDYELLFTVPHRKTRSVPMIFQGVKLTQIGQVTGQRGITLLRADSRTERLTAHGWDPFRR